MKSVYLVGALLLVLGLLSFVVPVPHRENHGVKIGDAKIGVQTESSEKLPPAMGVVLLAGGIIALVLGSRKPSESRSSTFLRLSTALLQSLLLRKHFPSASVLRFSCREPLWVGHKKRNPVPFD
jgi:hypothetical protein